MQRTQPQSHKVPYPPVATPRSSRSRAPIAVVMAAVGLLIAVAWFVFMSGGDDQPSAKGVVADPTMQVPIIGAVFTPTPVPPTPTPEPTIPVIVGEADGATASENGCAPLCLVRMSNNDASVSALTGFGAAPAYAHGSQLWTGITDDVLQELKLTGTPLEVIGGVSAGTSLYVVRLPDDAPEYLVSEVGEILDQVENQYVVAMSSKPPYVKELADWGISVEKMPPLIPDTSAVRADLQPIVDPWDVAASVSIAQLKQRVNDLTSAGAEVGDYGSRDYQTAGNVKTAEYIYRKLASYGLNVWYEDFIADNGTLLLNVVGEVPGADDSQIYLMTAHFDSISPDADTLDLAPGALDNSTGVSVLLETARALSSYELQHPVHVVFLNAEEYGLQGAKAFSRNASIKEERPYVGGINVDSVGLAIDENFLWVNAPDGDSQFMTDALVDTNQRWGLGIKIATRNNPKIRADEYELNQMGIPVVMVGSVLYGDPEDQHQKRHDRAGRFLVPAGRWAVDGPDDGRSCWLTESTSHVTS